MSITQKVYELDHSISDDDIAVVVRVIFSDPTASVIDGGAYELLNTTSFGVGTISIMRVSGEAVVSGDVRGWSTVLKIMDCSEVDESSQVGSPARELAAYESGVFRGGESGFRVAEAFGSVRRAGDVAMLWTEDLSFGFEPVRNSFQYVSAAQAIGQFQGRALRNGVHRQGWMNHNAGVRRWNSSEMMNLCDLIETHRENAYVRTALPGGVYDRALRFGDEIRLLTRATDLVPKVISHGDFHARNLFSGIGGDGDLEIVGIDLASAGIEPVGSDAGGLIGSSLTWGDEEADLVMAIEEEIFDSYVAGLRSEGCEVSVDLIRLGYLMSLCGYARGAASIPGVVAEGLEVGEAMLTRYGGAKQMLPYSYRRRVEFAVGVFDEAVELANRLLSSNPNISVSLAPR